MTLGRLLMHVAWTLAFPGAGQGAAGKRAWMMAWAAVALIAAVAVTLTVWAIYVAVAIHVASAVDAAVRLRRRRVEEEDRNLPLYASVVGVAAFLYFQLATDRYAIPAGSMLPTIASGDTVYIEKVTTLWSLPERGEVIVFEHPCEGRALVKRVIAVAWDSVETRCGTLYVNKQPVPKSGDRETLDGHTYATLPDGPAKDFPSLDGIVRGCPGKPNLPAGHTALSRLNADACAQQLEFMVPEGTVFVMGDNRASSSDSRYWGVVPVGNVKGRVIGVAWPPSHAGAVD